MRSGAAMDMGSIPGWQTEACPPWCTREHREDDHPEDRRHQSAGSVVAVEIPVTAIPGSGHRTTELAAYLDQPVGESLCWLRVESLDPAPLRFSLTTPSARDLVDAIDQELSRLED